MWRIDGASALLTDLYELTMAQVYFRRRMEIIQSRLSRELAALPDGMKALRSPDVYPVDFTM